MMARGDISEEEMGKLLKEYSTLFLKIILDNL